MINSQAATTPSPINTTRQLGRALPAPSISERSAVLGAAVRGSRNRAMIENATNARAAPRATTRNIIAVRLLPDSA